MQSKSKRGRHDPNFFLWLAACVADAATVSPNGSKTLLPNGLSTFLIKGNPVFNNGPKNLPKDPLDYPVLCNWVFDNFILADEPSAKVLRIFENILLFDYNLWRKLFHQYNHQWLLMKASKSL